MRNFDKAKPMCASHCGVSGHRDVCPLLLCLRRSQLLPDADMPTEFKVRLAFFRSLHIPHGILVESGCKRNPRNFATLLTYPCNDHGKGRSSDSARTDAGNLGQLKGMSEAAPSVPGHCYFYTNIYAIFTFVFALGTVYR